MSARFEIFVYYATLGCMLLRGTLYQLLRFQFRGWMLMGPGARVLGLKRIKLNGIVKIGVHALLDARFSQGVELGNRFSLGDFSIVRASGSIHFESTGIKMGDNVSFGPYSNIGGGYGLVIGNDCVFGPYVSIHPEGHVFSDLNTPIRLQGITGSGITIGGDNWFGAKCTVLDGVQIGSGCIFGAQSLIIKGNYASTHVYVGNPVRSVKSRGLS